MKKIKTYEEAISEIESIVKKLENSELNVDELSKDVQNSLKLIEFCKSKLCATEEHINRLINKDLS